MNNIEQIKPIYDVDKTFNKCKIIYGDREYILSNELFCRILNFERCFRIHNINDDYPSYKINNKYIDFLEFAYGFKTENYNFNFINGNKYDIRYDNIIIENKYFKELLKKFNVIEHIYNGTIVKEGRYSGQYKNPICKILNEKNEEEYLMLCNRNIICILCPHSYEKIKEFEKKNNYETPIIWSYKESGYILGNNSLYIHQVITDYFGNGKGTKELSIDHIDQNPLNNCFNNLRIVDRKTQEQNSKGIKENTKRERKNNAKPLPEGLTQEMMKKYVVYYNECYNKEKNLYREFFKIEKHPKLNKPYIGSKSNTISLKDKLNIVNKIVDDLDNNITNNEEIDKTKKRNLPKYISIQKTRNKSHLVFDRRNENKERQTMRSILPDVYDDILEEKLKIFAQQIQNKYNYKIT